MTFMLTVGRIVASGGIRLGRIRIGGVVAPATSFCLRPRLFTDLEGFSVSFSVSAATATATTVRG